MPLGLLSHLTEFSQQPSSPRPTLLLQKQLLESSGDSGPQGHTLSPLLGLGPATFSAGSRCQTPGLGLKSQGEVHLDSALWNSPTT